MVRSTRQSSTATGFFVPSTMTPVIVLNVRSTTLGVLSNQVGSPLLQTINTHPRSDGLDEGSRYLSSLDWTTSRHRSAAPGMGLAIRRCLGKPARSRATRTKSVTDCCRGWVWLSLPDLCNMRQDPAKYQEGDAPYTVYRTVLDGDDYLLNQRSSRLPALT